MLLFQSALSSWLYLTNIARDAPMVCHQFNEANGLCVDSHTPLSHIWPRPQYITSNDSSPAVVEFSNSTFSINNVGAHGGPLLDAAIKRFREKIFAPVSRSVRNSTDRGTPIALRVVVGGIDNHGVITEQDESYELSIDHGSNACSEIVLM